MKIQSAILLLCFLGLASFARAAIEASITDEVPGFYDNASAGTARLLEGSTTTCRFFLLTIDQMTNPQQPQLSVVLDVNGPPYDGSVDDLVFTISGVTLSYHHDLSRIVYDGPKCDCTVTVYQGLENTGKSKDYFAVGESGHIDLGFCYENRAESLSIVCDA